MQHFKVRMLQAPQGTHTIKAASVTAETSLGITLRVLEREITWADVCMHAHM